MTGITLKGLVVSRFGSATNMAQAIGWSDTKARDITSGRRAPRAEDMERLTEALGINNADDFVTIFFPEQSNNWTTSPDKN